MVTYIILISLIPILILLFLITRNTNIKWTKINDYLETITNTANSVRYGNLSTKINKPEHSTYQNVTDSINRMVETLKDRETMIVEYQNELMRQNKLSESAINSLSDGILVINENFEILRATSKISEWFGTKSKDLVGQNINDYIQIADDTPLTNTNKNDLYIKHTPTSNFVITSQNISIDDKSTNYVLIIKDITNERELEKLKEDFVATLTHDLKVPIVAAANILEFMLEGKFGDITEKQTEALKNMQVSNNELIELVQILLETYKVKGNGIELFKENIPLNSFINNIIDEMSPIANKHGISIKNNSQKELSVNADATQLTRVIKNLISNAISHSETTEKIDIVTNEIPDYITISIIDYGQGISEDEINMIFNKYYSAAKKFRKIGTGLGLYLSQQIINSHGGEITVISEQNVRTEFCIKLPI